MLEFTILVLTAYWLYSFFGQAIIPGFQHSGVFIDVLAVVIVVLISVKFLS